MYIVVGGFFVSWIFFNKCLFFIVHGWILSGQTSYFTANSPFRVIHNTFYSSRWSVTENGWNHHKNVLEYPSCFMVSQQGAYLFKRPGKSRHCLGFPAPVSEVGLPRGVWDTHLWQQKTNSITTCVSGIPNRDIALCYQQNKLPMSLLSIPFIIWFLQKVLLSKVGVWERYSKATAFIFFSSHT